MARQVTGSLRTTEFLYSQTGESLPYPFSFSFRCKVPVGSPVTGLPISYGEAYPDWDTEYGSAVVPTGFVLVTGRGATFIGSGTVGPIVAGQWYLVVCVIEATGRRIYVDSNAQTAFDSTAVAAPFHTNKRVTVGGLAETTGMLHSAVLFNGDVADVAIWNTALTATDVAALAMGRPGDVQAANLKGWWKLGADGDLTSSVGTYPAMTVVGTCPITDDPEYPVPTAPVPKITIPLSRFDPKYVPDHFELNRDLSHLKTAHYFWPLHGLRPYEEMLKNVPMVDVAIGTGLRQGVDGSLQMDGAIQSTGLIQSAGAATYSYSFWLKLYRGVPGGAYAGLFGFTPQTSGQGAALYVYETTLMSNFSNYAHNDGSWPIPPLNEWVHVCVQYQTRWYGMNYMRVWYNGKQVFARDNGPEGGFGWGDSTFYVGYGYIPGISGPAATVPGEMRQVCFSGSELWSLEEIERQAREPYEAYIPWTPRFYSFPAPPPDPTAVPDLYSPNTELTWVQKATHIWALHPAAPTRADKGGMTLELVGTGTLPTAVEPDNTIQFYGGNQTAARWYRTIGTFSFGDNPLVAGNQTPPAIGGMACWVKIDSFTQFTGLIGDSSGVTAGAHLLTNNTGITIGIVGTTLIAGSTPAAQWVHLAVQNDASTLRVYRNGVKVAEQAQTPSTTPDVQFWLAHDSWGQGANQNALIGQMRQVAVISGATWTDAEILEMYQRPFAYYGPPAPAHLVNTLGQGLEIVSHNFSIAYGPIAVNVLGQVLEVVSRDPSYIAGTIPVNVLAQNIEVVSHAIGAMVVPPFSLTLATQILELVRHDPAVVPGVTSINILRQTLEVVSRDPAVTAGPITVQALAHTIEVVARTLDGVISAPLAFQVATQILEMIAPAIKVFRPVVAPGRDYCIPAEDRTMEIAADGSVNCMSTICMGGSDVPFFVKSPAAVLDYKWDWTAWLGSDTILSHTVVCEDGGVVIDGSVHDLTTVVARISGGMTGDTCQVNCTIETEGNRTDQRTAVFLIQPK